MANLDEKNGLLTTLPPARLFLRAENLEFSGIVALARESDKRVYLFDRGKPVSARSNVEGEYLGALLKAGNKITIEQEEAAVRRLAEDPSKHFGEALISLGFIDSNTLIQFLCEQMLLRFNKALEWKEGRYALVPNLPADAPKIIQNDSVSSICFRGLLQRYTNSAEVRELQTTAVSIVVGGQTVDIARLQLDGKQMAFYRSINGVSTISEIIKNARLNEISAKAMLLALQDIQFIRIEVREAARETPAAPAVANEISKRWETCQKQNHFEVLGLTEKATAEEVKRKYLDSARKYHPDRLPKTLPPDIQKKAENFFARISEANSVLSNSVTRKEYEGSLAASAAGFTPEAAKKALESELEYQKGIIALRKGQFDFAVEALQHAIELYDQEPEYMIYLGWAFFRRSAKMGKTREFENARQMINKGLKIREHAEGFYFLGQIFKSENDLENAKKYFSHTLKLNPRHPEASSELRLINRRKETLKSGFGGMFR